MVRRQLRADRTWWIVVTLLIAVFNVAQLQGYRSVFPDAATRDRLLSAFANNDALRLFYGYPFDIGNATGWLAWRNMSTIDIIMGIWAAFITARALRGEEDSGRAELTLAQPRVRGAWLTATFVAISIQAAVIATANFGAMLAVGAPQGLVNSLDCLKLTLQLLLPVVLFAGLGAFFSQLFGSLRAARMAVVAVVFVAIIVRTPADIGDSRLTWLRWLTPLGWFEELRPPATPSMGAILLIVAAAIALAIGTARLLTLRDIGLGILPQNDSRAPRLRFLGGPGRAALRDSAPQIAMWVGGTAAYGFLMGLLIKTVLDLFTKDSTVSTFLGGSFGVNSFVAACFSLTELIGALCVAAMMTATRSEESSGRLDLIVAGPTSRVDWLIIRASVTLAIAIAIALSSALSLWLGAAAIGQSLSFGSTLDAAVNCLPIILIALGCSLVTFGLVPRWQAMVFAVVVVAFLWDALGAAIKAPGWLLNLSPFHALARVPADSFALAPAVVISGTGLALAIVGIIMFHRRDMVAG
jgi:ABC-2 type transport system permease protein